MEEKLGHYYRCGRLRIADDRQLDFGGCSRMDNGDDDPTEIYFQMEAN
jgi:hypothetical protein